MREKNYGLDAEIRVSQPQVDGLELPDWGPGISIETTREIAASFLRSEMISRVESLENDALLNVSISLPRPEGILKPGE